MKEKTDAFLRWQSAAGEVIRADRKSSALERLVLFVLATHADADGACWVSFNTIALECGFSRRTGLRVVEKLEARKKLVCFRTRGPNDERACNTYRLNLAARGASDRVTPPGVPRSPSGARESPEQTNTSGSLSISSSQLLSEPPPSMSTTAAADSRIFSDRILNLACRLFGAGVSRRQVASSLRRFVHRAGELGEDELANFLRHQHQTRDVRGARVPIEVVCDVEDLARWRRRAAELAKVEPETERPPTDEERAQNRASAQRAREAFSKLARRQSTSAAAGRSRSANTTPR